MPCPIKLPSESLQICYEALKYWYEVKTDGQNIEKIEKEIDEYKQVKKMLFDAFTRTWMIEGKEKDILK